MWLGVFVFLFLFKCSQRLWWANDVLGRWALLNVSRNQASLVLIKKIGLEAQRRY